MLPLPETTTATRKNIVRKYKLSEFPDPAPFLHIRCGDDILGKLDDAGIPGEKIRWLDVLCEGPLVDAEDDSARQKGRAAYLTARYGVPMTETFRDMMGQDLRIKQGARYDEVVLWFEADLFDQSILVFLLHQLAPLATETRISLICIGEFPEVERFIGLGQLSASQLATLLPQRKTITQGQFALAHQTWKALNRSWPSELSRLSRTRSKALPFLPEALRRYLAEYPSTRNGLSKTEQLALEAVAEGAQTPSEAFLAVQGREARPFMGDSMFYAVLRDLASGDHPALAGSHKNLVRLGDAELRGCAIWLTALGKKLLHHQADWCALSGRSKWIGGVLLQGPTPRWRWDPNRERLVEQRGNARS